MKKWKNMRETCSDDILLYSQIRALFRQQLPPAVDGNKYKDPHPDIMQQVRSEKTLEHLPLNGISPSNFLS